MARTEIRRRPALDPPPPAKRLSATMPVIVRVSTVVVRSGTASLRAVAFWSPIEVPRAMIRGVGVSGGHGVSGQRQENH
jgi:hypothetical protein